MSNRWLIIFLSTYPPNPVMHTCPNNEMDTLPHLLFTWTKQYIKGLHINRHNETIHQVVHTFDSTSILYYVYLIMQVTTTHVHMIPSYLSGCCIVHAPLPHTHAWPTFEHTYYAYEEPLMTITPTKFSPLNIIQFM